MLFVKLCGILMGVFTSLLDLPICLQFVDI